MPKHEEIKSVLDDQLSRINLVEFTANDPIQIPKRFKKKQDIEIAAFFACILAWGNRKTIINNTNKLMHWMGEEPYRFVTEHQQTDLIPFQHFVHRTFNGTDCLYFIEVLKAFYSEADSLESYFQGTTMKQRIHSFHLAFFNFDFAPPRTTKHIANPIKNSSAKRLNMFLRWMVREAQVDFGLWKSISPSQLKCPLDIHVQRAAMHFDLLTRKQQDWKAVEELSNNLLLLDKKDPIKYDLALFTYGLNRLT